METPAVENAGEQATAPQETTAPLVVGGKLPPSSFHRNYLVVHRDDVVHHAVLPPCLQDLKSSNWMKAGLLKDLFTIPIPPRNANDGASRTRTKKTHYVFPYCLLAFGEAATCPRERLIVLDWWLNRTKDEQKEIKDRLKKQFVAPSKTATLVNQYNPDRPIAIQPGDSLALRQPRVESSHSHHLLFGGRKRLKADDPPKSNAQLRDVHVQRPESNIQDHLLKTYDRSHINDENSSLVTARYHGVYSTSSTAFTPEQARPKVGPRREAKTRYFADTREKLEQHFEDTFGSYLTGADGSRITGDMLVSAIESNPNADLYYANDRENWPFVHFRQRRSGPTPLGENGATTEDATPAQAGAPLLTDTDASNSSFESFGDDAVYL